MEYRSLVIDPNTVPEGLIDLESSYKYSSRVPEPSLDILNKKIENTLHRVKQKPSLILQAVIDNALAELDGFDRTSTNRYYSKLSVIAADKYNSIEMLGGMRYSKTRTRIYSLHDKLDYAISYLFDTPLEVVRERLLTNCERFGIDYEILSYAFCSTDPTYLEQIPLQVLIGISSTLDSHIIDIIMDPEHCIFSIGNNIIPFNQPGLSHEERITAFIVSKIIHFNQLYINSIIQLFKQREHPFVCSRNCMLVSKGIFNVVITTAGYGDNLPVLDCVIENFEAMKLVPIEINSLGEYNENNWYSKSI